MQRVLHLNFSYYVRSLIKDVATYGNINCKHCVVKMHHFIVKARTDDTVFVHLRLKIQTFDEDGGGGVGKGGRHINYFVISFRRFKIFLAL